MSFICVVVRDDHTVARYWDVSGGHNCVSCRRLAVMTTHGTAEARDDADETGEQYQKHHNTDHNNCYKSVHKNIYEIIHACSRLV